MPTPLEMRFAAAGAKATGHTLELHLQDGEQYSVNCLSHFK
jgi:hypothetical protein